jgi:DNA-directed RNA polymerase specialized sigma24 family protein
MRPSNLAAHRGALEALRAGGSFDVAARQVRPALELRAERFLRIWRWSGQTSLGVEDLTQEMLVALWRAVDAWDPSKADLVRYIDAQLGRACQRRLRQVAGYPDPRRRAPARQVLAEPSVVVDAIDRAREGGEDMPPEEALDARRRALQVVDGLVGLERQVVELVLEGRSLDETTRVIYADRSARITYRMDSMGHARRMVGAAARRAASAASA